jgi:hypothetical protein
MIQSCFFYINQGLMLTNYTFNSNKRPTLLLKFDNEEDMIVWRDAFDEHSHYKEF